MKRDPVSAIVRYNKGFDPASLRRKIDAMAASPFDFFRATSHLFAVDGAVDPKRPSGPIAGDLHCENFGSFRAVSNEIVYDINDFDDTATGPYEYDLRRLLASLVIGGAQAKLRLAPCVAACEAAVDEYCASLGRFAKASSRKAFENLQPASSVKALLSVAGEKSRVEMLRKLVTQDKKSKGFRFLPLPKKFAAIDARQRAAIEKALPGYLANCLAPAGAETSRYGLEDAVFRFAGKGSLGRQRYALLLRKRADASPTLSELRLVEWKEAFDSPIATRNAQKREQSRKRAVEVTAATVSFQLHPKRYLGSAVIDGIPFQGREIGANDDRFSPETYADASALSKAAKVFGGITARAHLLASLGKAGPRPLAAEPLTRRLVAFAIDYADVVQRDFEVFRQRQDEVGKLLGLSR